MIDAPIKCHFSNVASDGLHAVFCASLPSTQLHELPTELFFVAFCKRLSDAPSQTIDDVQQQFAPFLRTVHHVSSINFTFDSQEYFALFKDESHAKFILWQANKESFWLGKLHGLNEHFSSFVALNAAMPLPDESHVTQLKSLLLKEHQRFKRSIIMQTASQLSQASARCIARSASSVSSQVSQKSQLSQPQSQPFIPRSVACTKRHSLSSQSSNVSFSQINAASQVDAQILKENKERLKKYMLYELKKSGIDQNHAEFAVYWKSLYSNCQFQLRKEIGSAVIRRDVLFNAVKRNVQELISKSRF